VSSPLSLKTIRWYLDIGYGPRGYATSATEIDFSPEREAKLDRFTTQQGRDAQALVREAVNGCSTTTSGALAKSRKDWSRSSRAKCWNTTKSGKDWRSSVTGDILCVSCTIAIAQDEHTHLHRADASPHYRCPGDGIGRTRPTPVPLARMLIAEKSNLF
jgi:hypothetical protein